MKKLKLIIGKIRLRTWVSLGMIIIITPLLFAAVYGVFGALGGSSATPIAYWAFDEGVDNTCSGGSNDACDSSGNTNDGAFGATTAAPAWQTEDKCVSGKCIYTDGSNDTVTVSNTVSGVQTVSFWVKPITTTEEYLALNGSAYITTSSGTVTATGFTSPTYYINGQATTTPTVSANQWTHIAVTTGTGISASAITIGNQSTNFGNQFLDEMKLFDSALSAAQIKAEYAGGAAVLGTQDTDFLNQGLVGYWPMDEAAANTCTGGTNDSCDKSGNVLDGAWQADATSGAGKFGNAVSLDGTGDYVNMGNQSKLKVGTSNWTVASWFYPDIATGAIFMLGQGNPFNTDGDGYDLGYRGDTANDPIQFRINDGTALGQTLSYNAGDITGAWHHVAVTVTQGERLRMYLDGVEVTTAAYTLTGSVDGTNPFVIGAISSGTAGNFDGRLDEARVYNRALSGSEVKALYNWAPGPVGYWNFDEGSGSTAYDRSGSNSNGSITGAVYTGGKFGKGLEFDGSDDNVDVGDVDNLEFTEDFSIASWFKNSSNGTDEVLINEGTDTDWLYAIALSTGNQLYCKVYQENSSSGYLQATTTTNFRDGVWHHVGCTLSEDNLFLYVDGVLVASDITTTGTRDTSTAGTFSIGWFNSSSNHLPYDGQLDEVKVYNYARTDQQIVEDMNAGHPTGGSPVGSQLSYWKFDDVYGDTAYDLGSSETNGDVGGSGQTCPATGSTTCPTVVEGKFDKGLHFDASDDYINLGNISEYKIASKTVTFWANQDDTPSTTEAVLSNGHANWYVGFTSTNRMITSHSVTAGTQQTTNSNTSVTTPGTWSHYAYVFDVSGSNVTIRFYVNGQPAGSSSYSTGYSGTYGTAFILGAFTPTTFRYDGQLDEVKVYSSALTQEQVNIDYNRGAAVNFGGGADAADDIVDGAGDLPVVYWDLNDKVSGNGQTLLDKTGGGYSLTTSDGANDTGMNCTGTGKYGSSCLFDGTDDLASITNPSFDDFGTGEMSVSAWVKTGATPGSLYLLVDNKTAGTNNAGFNLYINSSNQVAFRIANGSAQTSAAAVNNSIVDGKWHHLVGTLTRGTPNVLSVYMDGKLLTTANPAADGWNITSSQNLLLGAHGTSSGNSNLNGSLDEIKVWDYALTPAQVVYEFNRGKPLAWFRFDECTGSTANDSGSGNTDLTITIGATGGNTSTGDCNSGTGTEAWNNGTSGKFNGSLDFDGTDDWADYSGQIVDNPMTTASFSVWVNPDTVSGTDYILEQISGAIQIHRSGTQWNVLVRNAATTSVAATGGVATVGTWQHVVGVYDGTNITLYVNGAQVAQSAQSGALFNSTQNFIVGCDGNTSNVCISDTYYDGKIDDIQIFGYALSTNQVKKIYNGGSSVRF